MARFKWSNTGASLIAAQVRDGAEVRGIDEPPVPQGEVRHTHIYLDGWAPTQTAARARDAAPAARPVTRRGDQAGEAAVLCRLGQHGSTGEWMAEDGAGRPLTVRPAGDGTLEILHHPDNGEANSGAPTEFGMKSPLADRRGFADLAPSQSTAEENPRRLGRLQRLLDQHYQR